MESPNQLFIQSLDVAFLGIISLVTGIANAQKDDEFFVEKEGEMTLNKRNYDNDSILADEMLPDGTFEQGEAAMGRR